MEPMKKNLEGKLTGKSGKNSKLFEKLQDLPRFEEDDEGKQRFEVELEFVQCLSNPHYLNFLAQNGYFKDPAFVNYLSYLQYWKEPQYAIFLKYPQCLHFLELLQHEEFRKELMHPACVKFIDEQMLLHWQYYSRRRRGIIPPPSDDQQR